MTSVRPFLWFDSEAEAAARLYVSIFPDSKIHSVARYPDGAGPLAGKVLTVDFEVAGQRVIALNAGPQYKLNEAFSFYVETQDQAETDSYWNGLIADGGAPGQCGWLKDRFGLSWQIIPEALPRLMNDTDGARAGRVMNALMQMQKIVVADLERAHAGD